MPIYEFRCTECGKQFSLTETFKEHEKHQENCPDCHGKDLEPVFNRVNVKTSRKS